MPVGGTIQSQNSLKVNPGTSEVEVGSLRTYGPITASGNIWASGSSGKVTGISGSFDFVQINTTSDTRALNVGGVIDCDGIYSTFGNFSTNITANGNIVGDNSTDISGIRNLTILGNSSMGDSDSDTHTFTGTVTTNTEINAVAGISSSAPIQTETLTGVGNTTGLVVAGFISASEFIAKGHITASGDISASGNIISTRTGSFADIQSNGGINLVNQVSGYQFDNIPVFYHDGSHHQIGVSDNKGNIQWFSTTFSGSIYAKGQTTSSGPVLAEDSITVKSSDYIQIQVDQTDSGKATFGVGSNSSEVFLSSHTNNAGYDADIKFLTNDGSGNSEIVRFKEDGKVGIGTDAPGEKLEVSGNISASGFISASSFSGDGSGLTNLPSSTAAGTISSSAQIATEITGAFHAASSSFSTRVTTNDAKVGYTDAAVVVVLNDYGVISGSAQLPSGIFSSSLQTFTNITASGNLSVSGSIYSDQYVYNKTTSATDGVSTGDIIYWGEATATTAGKIYYYNSDGGWTISNADALADAKGLLAVATNDNSSKGMLIRGTTTLADIDGTNDEGLPIYLDTTDGDANVNAPTTSGHIVRIIGYLLSSSDRKVWFDPDKTWVELV